MLSPTVSVILPNYNHTLYLEQRITSIVNQSFQDFELILLDDYSTDQSAEVLRRYEFHPKVSHLIFNKKNSGSTFRQWKKGIELARGEYIWIAESDDYSDLSFLAEMVAALQKHPEAVIAFSGSQMVDSNGNNLTMDWDHFKNNAGETVLYEGAFFLKKRMLWKNTIYNASMVVFRKSCYKEEKPDYQNYRYCGDWLFWSEICRKGEVIEIRKKLNFFRQHTDKVSPGAEKEGLYFSEGSKVIQYNADFLHLSTYQKQVIIGRTLKRLNTLPVKKRKQIISENKQICKNNLVKNYLSISLYEIDKLFNLSELQR